MSQRYQSMFKCLQQANEGAFVPFVVLGDPNPGLSMQIVDALVAGGADALELGIPFSDPLADGPTIQNAAVRALNNGTTPALCFNMLTSIRTKYPDLSIGLLLYANLVVAPGIDQFYRKCADAGVDSVLIADVPVEMSAPFTEAAEKAGISSIFIAPANADKATLETIATLSAGYTYLLSRAGVTGAEKEAGMPVEHIVDGLNEHHAPPALLGFGISLPEHVKSAISAGAAGVISGSAVVKTIEKYLDKPETMLMELTSYVAEMKAATRCST